ncbi:MAG TPA: CDP-alcohol phosphatidyltransferase family protein [Polyangiaceae bacterium]|nr:CDP-alcohol phosphatidyltransferase family protein [Polyangiaceae bacterium]
MSAVEVYRKTRKTPDLFWNMYVCRPIAAVLVDGVKGTRITPNQITLMSYVVAMAAAALLVLLPGYLGLCVAILVYQLSYVLDCADGMLARWRGIQSTPGHLLDFLMDELKAFAILAAAAVRLYRDSDSELFLLIGLGGLVCLASGIAMTTFERRPEIAPPKATGASPPAPPSLVKRLAGLPFAVAKFLIHYPSYILLAALLGRLELYFYPYVAVNAVYMLRSLAVVTLKFGR